MSRIAVLSVLLAVTSCLSREFTEQNPFISVDTRHVVVLSDVDTGEVRDTLWVTSNRSWGAALSEEVSWVKLGEVGAENMAGVSKITALPLTFENNTSDQDRSVELMIHSGELTEKIVVTQEAKSYRLSLVPVSENISDISADGDTLEISFLCNTDWEAYMSYNDGMLVNLSTYEGNGPSTLTAVVKPNTDNDKDRKAVLTLSATGCPEVDIVLVQNRRIPYFVVEGGNEVVLKPGADNHMISFRTNQYWKAEIVSVENYDLSKVSLSASEGPMSEKNVKVLFPACVEFGKQGKIEVEIIADELSEPILVSMTQDPAIRASFGTPITADTWPFTVPAYAEFTNSSATAKYVGVETEFVLKNGYSFYMYSTRGFWRNTATGFMGAGTAGDYIELPVVEGFRPVKIEYKYLGETPIRCDVRSAEGRVLEGSVFNAATNKVTSVVLNGTVATEKYRIVTLNTQTLALDDIAVYYE